MLVQKRDKSIQVFDANKIKQAIKEHKIKGIIVFFNEISIKLNFFVNISQHLLKILILIKVSIYVLNLENIE